MTSLTLLLLVTACAAPSGESNGEETPSTTADDTRGIPRGATPDAVYESIIADLADRTGADPADFVIVRDEEATWNDGSLGCPKPGEVYTQAPVTGYWVVLSVNERQYDYRAHGSGTFVYCDAPLPGGAPTG